MIEPVCPPEYACTFTPKRAPTYDVWWEGPWGIVAAIITVVAVAILLGVISYHLWQAREAKLEAKERERLRNHELAIEEQRTMQLDAAKGDPEVLKLIREDRAVRGRSA